MAMTIQDWGALGELVGAVAVVVTLIFLTTQIRQNTKTMRATAVEAAMSRSADLYSALINDKELHALLRRSLGGERLDDDEWGRVMLFHYMNLRSVETALYQREQRLFDEQTFDGLWNQGLTNFCRNPQYREFIDNALGISGRLRAHIRSFYPDADGRDVDQGDGS